MSATKFTPGPWGWFGQAEHQSLYLATVDRGRQYVMGFERWGMRRAQPYFRSGDRLVPAAKLLTFEVGGKSVVGVDAAKQDPSVYRLDVSGIASPDATLIVAAPDLAEAAQEVLAHREGNLPGKGWLRDTDQSRAALAKLAAALAKATGGRS